MVRALTATRFQFSRREEVTVFRFVLLIGGESVVRNFL